MKKSQSKVSQLTLAAVLIALFVILHVVIPGGQKAIQSLLMVVTFLPITIYSLCCGTKKTLIMATAGCAVCALLTAPEVMLSYAVPALVMGVIGGVFYGKLKRPAVILIFSVMHLLQNIAELCVYYVLAKINFMDTYLWAVDFVYERIPADWLTISVVSRFLEDLMKCSVPCVAILGAGAKGIISFLLLTLIHERMESIIGFGVDPKYGQQIRFSGSGISVACFCAVCVCAIIAALTLLSVIPYTIAGAIAAAFGILLAVIYMYYFYSNRVRPQKDHRKRLIYSFLLVVLLPVNIFVLPLLEIYLLKKMQK